MVWAAGSVVWVELGHSYGWWPAMVAAASHRPRVAPGPASTHLAVDINSPSDILAELGEEFGDEPDKDSKAVLVKFFDDDDLELVPVVDPKKIENYSSKNKTKYIKAGFRRHEENKRGALGGANLRLAQFYKDVEMAEVMTDNDVAVANILATYEIAETDNVVGEPIPVPQAKPTSSKKRGKRKKSAKPEDVLREVKNGGVGKAKKAKTK
jgi:hypothetical protein